MPDELAELLDTALYKEIAAQAFYIAGQKKTEDAGAKALMQELAGEEAKHAELLKSFRDKGAKKGAFRRERVPDLRLSDYLTDGTSLEGAGLQDTLIFAIKREQQSIEFYLGLMGLLRDRNAKQMCERLVQEELRHKLRLEMLYDDLFYGED
ncbi:MAG: ferritin family protein [Chloroflexota bacterium]